MADLTVTPPKPVDSLNLNRTQYNQVTPEQVKSQFGQTAKNELTQPEAIRQTDVPTSLDALTRPGEVLAPLEASELDEVVNTLNAQMTQFANYLRFEKDTDSDKMVVFIKNGETDEIIRQIPTQEFLAMSKNINQYLEMRQSQSQPMATPTGLFTRETA